MRELKFRAWDDELKEMLYSKLEQYDDMLAFRFKHFETDNDPIYMQFINEHDKNNKEIYEGDIVKCYLSEGSAGYLWDEAFLNGSETYVIREIQPLSSYGEGLPDQEFLEIIGNIYENPELLKD